MDPVHPVCVPLVLIASCVAGCSPHTAVLSAAVLAPGPQSVARSARAAGLRAPFRRVFLRLFKREGQMELWAGGERMSLLRTYPIAAMSGTLGPKRREGDLQVPEGVYRIVRFNPKSQYHLSMGLDYPNASDRRRGATGRDIYIHGNRVSAGCMAMTDPLIDEIYPLCLSAGNHRAIPVHVFPARLTTANLDALCAGSPRNAAFWRELKPVYDAFERTRVVPAVWTTREGAYVLAGRTRVRGPGPG